MVNWSEIDAVLVDMDGTLLDLSFDNYFWLHYLPEKYAARKSIALAEAERTVQELAASLHGEIRWYCLDYWSERLSMDLEALKKEVSHRVRKRPHSLEFLRFLQRLDKHVMLVTNAHPKSLKLKMEASGLRPHLHRLISSHQLQLAKENPGFWTKLAALTRIDLDRSLYIDDSAAALQCARAEGIRHTIQILLPDTTLAPQTATDFPGVLHLDELMRA